MAEEETVVEPQPEPQVEPQAAEPQADPNTFTTAQQGMLKRVIQHRDAQWQQHMQQQQQAQPQQVQEPQTDVETRARKLYTDDEVGQKTYEAIRDHMKIAGEETAGQQADTVTREEAASLAAAAADQVRNQVQSGYKITQTVTDLVLTGAIKPEDAQTVQTEFDARMVDPTTAQVASTPAGAEIVLKNVVYDLVMKDKKITPHPQPVAPTPVFTPGGNGAPVAPEQNPQLDPQNSPFQAVRDLDKARMIELDGISKANYKGAH